VSWLLDTNVVSEWVKPKPSPAVAGWLDEVDEDQVFMSVVCFAELRRGVELLPRGRRRESLRLWLEDDLTVRFERRILGVDLPVADAWGHVTAAATRRGHRLGTMDALLAATALTHDLTLVTRNRRDFEGTGVELFDPWEP